MHGFDSGFGGDRRCATAAGAAPRAPCRRRRGSRRPAVPVMRIALISFEYPPETPGGIATYASHATRMLAARGHEVTVFAGTVRSGRDEQFQGVRVVRIPCAERRSFHEPAVARLADAHGRTPFDVAEVPDLYAEGAGLRDRVPSLPIVLRAHTPLFIPAEIDYSALAKGNRAD